MKWMFRSGLAALALGVLATSQLWAAGNLTDGPDADLLYDPATGQVQLDPTDTEAQRFVTFVLVNPSGSMTPIPDTRLPLFPEAEQGDNTPGQIGFTDLTLKGREGMLDLGPIFPTGMGTPEELSEFLQTAKYGSALGKGGNFDLVVVPEPAALALLSLGLLGLVRTARAGRRRS